MSIPYLKCDELLALLRNNGWIVVSDHDWESHDRIMIGKDGHTFPLQIKQCYYYPHVVRLCRSLDIPPPADHLKMVEQYEAYKLAQKEKDNE